MSIARDTIGTPSSSGVSATITNTFNNVAGNFLVVALYFDKNATVTAATYNGVALTNTKTVSMTGWAYQIAIYTLVSPATGSHTISFSLSGNAQASSIYPVSYSGVDTVSPIDSSASNYLTGAAGTQTQTINLTPTTSTGWMVGFAQSSGTGIAGGTGTTLITGGTTQTSLYDTNGTVASGSRSLNINWSGLSSTEGAAMVGFSFKAPTVVNNSAMLAFF